MSSNEPVTPASQIQQAISDTAAPANGGMPLEVRLETGQIYKGATPQELLNQLVQAQTHASRTIQQRTQDIEALQTEVQALKKQIPPPPVNASETEKQNYYNTWAQDPDKAFDEQLSKRFGIPADKVGEVIKRTFGQNVVTSAAEEFKSRTPDYPEGDAHVAELMRQRLEMKYGADPSSVTADNLIVVYHDLKNEGRIQPRALPSRAVAEPNIPLPNLRGGSAPQNPVNDIMSQFSNLSLEDMKKTIERLQAQGAR